MTCTEFADRILAMQETLYRVSYSLLPQSCDREDAVQEAIRIAWQKQDTLREEKYMKTWVIRILIHECYTMLRKRKREFPTESLPERIAPPDADPDIHDAMLKLPEHFRVPILLHYIEGYPLKDVAKMMRLPIGTVKSRLNRARGMLRETMLDEEVVRA